MAIVMKMTEKETTDEDEEKRNAMDTRLRPSLPDFRQEKKDRVHHHFLLPRDDAREEDYDNDYEDDGGKKSGVD